LATVLDRKLVPRLGDLVGIAGELRRIGMRIAARKAAADIDGIDENAGRHYKLADLPQRIAAGPRNDRPRSDMEGNPEPAGDLSRTQQQSRSFGHRDAELAFKRNETVRVWAGNSEVEIEIRRTSALLEDLVELLIAVEGEVPHAKLVICRVDRAPRLHRIHEIELGIRHRR